MADEDTPIAEEATTAAPAGAAADDPIGLIEDNIVRRLVRAAVHVRGYAPYYAATIAFGIMLLVVPGLGGNDDQPDTFAAGVTGGGGTTSAPSGATSRPAAPVELAGADDFFEPTISTEATRSSVATSYSFDDADFESDDDGSGSPAASEPDESDKPCYLHPPADAPVSPVSPDREVANVQTTLESAAGQEGPAEASEPVKSAAEATGQCNGGAGAESSASVPSTPVTSNAPAVDKDAVVDLVGNMFVY